MFVRKHCKRCPSCFKLLDYTFESTWKDSKWAPTDMQHVIGFNFRANIHNVIHVGGHKEFVKFWKSQQYKELKLGKNILGSRISIRFSKKHLINCIDYNECLGVFCYNCGFVSFESKEMLVNTLLFKCNKSDWDKI